MEASTLGYDWLLLPPAGDRNEHGFQLSRPVALFAGGVGDGFHGLGPGNHIARGRVPVQFLDGGDTGEKTPR